MNRNLKSMHRYALTVVGALSLAATQAYAAGSNAYPMAKSRDEVKAELQDARAAGQVPADQPVEQLGQQQGAQARFVHVRGDQEPASTLTRAEVQDEVRQIRESGQLLNSDPQRSRFRPDTAAVIESPAPVIILSPAPEAPPQVTAPRGSPSPSAEDVTPDDAPLQSDQAPADGNW